MTSKLSITSDILNGIISASKIAKKKYKIPYVFKWGKTITYIGVSHSKTPHKPHFKLIERLFQEFIADNKNNAIAVLENFVPQLKDSSNKMIKSFGETGLVTYLADKYGIEKIVIEPEQKIILNFVERKFKKFDIALWIFLNYISVRFNSVDKLSEKEIVGFISILDKQLKINRLEKVVNVRNKKDAIKKYYLESWRKKLLAISGYEYLPGIIKTIKKNDLDLAAIKKLQNPWQDKTLLNKIGVEMNDARDRLMLLSILKLLASGKKIFAVFGANHVVAQEPALKRFIKKEGTHDGAPQETDDDDQSSSQPAVPQVTQSRA